MTDMFNENMTSIEARMLFYREIEGKTEDEVREIRKAYETAMKSISKKELAKAREGWLC